MAAADGERGIVRIAIAIAGDECISVRVGRIGIGGRERTDQSGDRLVLGHTAAVEADVRGGLVGQAEHQVVARVARVVDLEVLGADGDQVAVAAGAGEAAAADRVGAVVGDDGDIAGRKCARAPADGGTVDGNGSVDDPLVMLGARCVAVDFDVQRRT